MREAIVASTAHTPIGKAYRGAFHDTGGPTLAAFAIREAIARAKVGLEEIGDVILGAALQRGTQGFNVARQSILTSGLPVSVPGQSADRQCSSSLMSVSMAAKQIIADGRSVVVAGGLASISLVQDEQMYSRSRNLLNSPG